MSQTLQNISPQTVAIDQAMLASFNLTKQEFKEVNKAQKLFANPNNRALLKAYLRKVSGNVGVQYLMLSDPHLAFILAKNPKLHIKLVPLMLRSVPELYLEIIVPNLFSNEAVVFNVEAFKLIFRIHLIQQKNIRGLKNENEILFPKYSNVEFMGIDCFLVILSYVYRNKETQSNNYELASRVAVDRKDEITVWIDENMPDLSGLPLAWVLNAVDFY